MIKNYIKDGIKKTDTYRTLEIRKDKLEDEVGNLNQDNKKLKNQLEELKDKVQKLSSDNRKLDLQLQKLTTTTERLKNRVSRLNFENDNFKMLGNNLKAETKSLKQIYLQKDISFTPDFSKLTFIIPYRKTDDPQREENMDITLNYLSRVGGIKNVIISELSNESSKPFLMDAFSSLFDSFKTVFTYDDGELFNKSRALNQGVIQSTTPYFVTSDSDSLTEGKNILLAVYLLDKGFDIVHPFNRVVKDIVDKKTFREDYEFNAVESPAQHRDWADGGIVFWNKRSFIEIGMNNEYFSGWGGEDNEILNRANLCELKQIRIDDVLYHLYHHRPKLRNDENMKHMAKILQIKSKEELLEEISQWPWMKEMEGYLKD